MVDSTSVSTFDDFKEQIVFWAISKPQNADLY